MAFQRTVTDPVPELKEKAFCDQGIDAFHGRAAFTGPNLLEVNGEALAGTQIVLACGAEPMALNVAGEEHLVDNEGFLSLTSMPRRVVFVSGGYPRTSGTCCDVR